VTSRSTHHLRTDDPTTLEEQDTTKTMIVTAVRYSRTTLTDRIAMRDLLNALDRYAELERAVAGEVPLIFRAALRQPVGSRRRTITVLIDDTKTALLLNPQGRDDPVREQWLWDFVCARVRQGAK
jgi:hypothetical protein